MFVLAYRNANGSLRVGPFAFSANDSLAKNKARSLSHSFGRTVTVLDLTDVLFALNEADYDAHRNCCNNCADDGYCCDCGNCFACTIGGCQACYYDVCDKAEHEGSLSPHVATEHNSLCVRGGYDHTHLDAI